MRATNYADKLRALEAAQHARDDLARAAWAVLAERPAEVEELSAGAVRALLRWNDANGDFGDLDGDTARECLYYCILAESVIEAYHAIAENLTARGYSNCPRDELRCIAAARTPDHADGAECEEWLDDMVARCGLPQDLADDLLAAIADDYHVFNR